MSIGIATVLRLMRFTCCRQSLATGCLQDALRQ